MLWFAGVGGLESVTGDDFDAGGWGFLVVSQLGSQLGLIAAPLYLTRRRGSGSLAHDFGLRFRGVDGAIALGATLGVTQLIALVYLPLSRFISDEQVAEPARELTERAGEGVGFGLLVVMVVIGAPLAEELFFRGLVQPALIRRLGPPVGILGGAAVFGLAHFQAPQFPALFVLGIVLGALAHGTRRLGPAIATHAAFNGLTMLSLALSR